MFSDTHQNNNTTIFFITNSLVASTNLYFGSNNGITPAGIQLVGVTQTNSTELLKMYTNTKGSDYALMF